MSDEVVIRLTPEAALVLLMLVARLNQSETMDFQDQAEQRVLWDLEADLEANVAAVLTVDFRGQVMRARDHVRDSE